MLEGGRAGDTLDEGVADGGVRLGKRGARIQKPFRAVTVGVFPVSFRPSQRDHWHHQMGPLHLPVASSKHCHMRREYKGKASRTSIYSKPSSCP